MITVFIGIGSNLANRQNYINKAIFYLKLAEGVRVEKVSTIIETEPVEGPVQGRYLNGVIKIKTILLPQELLNILQNIENKLGRRRVVRFGPRTIDLDILLYGNKIIDQDNLKIPHPRMWEREFVLKPLFEIAPDIVCKENILSHKL